MTPQNKNMKTLSLFLMISLSVPTFAKMKKGEDFKQRFLFTHLHKKSAKGPIDEVSKCFKFNKPSQEILQSYDQCRPDPKLVSPLDEAIGTCVRKDGANAYFFEEIKECDSARTEILDEIAASKE